VLDGKGQGQFWGNIAAQSKVFYSENFWTHATLPVGCERSGGIAQHG